MFTSKAKALALKNELDELRSRHRIELAEKESAHARELGEKKHEFERSVRETRKELSELEAKLRKENEIKVREMTSLLKLESDQKVKQMEIDSQRKIDDIKREFDAKLVAEKQRLMDEHYKKLADSLQNLHEKGNVTTQFIRDFSMKMLEQGPKSTTETRVLTGTVEPEGKKK